MPEEKELDSEKPKDDEEKDPEEEEKDAGELLDADFELGSEFKDQLIPLALEYYLEVVNEEDGDDCDDDDCQDCGDHDHSDDEHHDK
jgi:nucleosome assembly protein 1-like 1